MLDNLNSEKEIEYLERDSEFVFKLNNKVKFRLPTGEDELAVFGNSTLQIENELLTRCIIEGNEKNDLVNVQETLENLSPLINLNFEVRCPECDNIQILHFDIQHYLLSSLLQEQKQLIYEVHKLAHAYKWGLKEILELPRSIRRAYISVMDQY